MSDGTSREARITAAFVTVADTLTTDYDVVDLLHTLVQECAGILSMRAGGLMIVDAQGDLHLITSTSEAADFVEMMQLASSSGPCIDCFETGLAVTVANISATGAQWPEFQRAALGQGFASVLSTPMKLRGKVIGTMNLFSDTVGEVTARDAAVAQALADVATIGMLQERVIREGHVMEEQLRRALDGRILIEQAKGVLASALDISMDAAFSLLRTYARDHNLTIRQVAGGVSRREFSAKSVRAAIESTHGRT